MELELKLFDSEGQLSLLEPITEGEVRKRPPKPRRRVDEMELIAVPYQYCDLTPGHGDLLGDARWETRSPFLEDGTILNTGVAPRKPIYSSLSSILENHPAKKYYLSRTACLGILRRADERGKQLPEQLEAALMAQAGLAPFRIVEDGLKAYHINQRDEGIDLDGVSGALMATTNMQMQTFVTGEPVAFAANQRDEVRDLHDVAGAICACQTMKQQTFVATGCLTPWDTQQKRIILPDGVAPTLAGADGGGGRDPGGLVFAAGFSAGQGAKAGGIGWQKETAPTLKGSESGTNMVPSILCLNDQGGAVMEVSEEVSGTLRAQEHGHQPLVFENHGIDSRYTGPHKIAPTLSARAGTGGNNLPLVAEETTEEETPVLCITGNAIDRQPKNGGNGLGVDEGVAFTLTATDHHAVFYQQTVGALMAGDHKGAGNQYVSQDKLILEAPLLIRRLTPLECERLQGFPDRWTALPNAADSARYKALGNSVAIPCVDFVLMGIALALRMLL